MAEAAVHGLQTGRQVPIAVALSGFSERGRPARIRRRMLHP